MALGGKKALGVYLGGKQGGFLVMQLFVIFCLSL